MKKLFAMMMSLLLICGMCAAEEDAVSSATIRMDRYPEVEAADSHILVVYFSPEDTERLAAYIIAGELNAELFEIVPEEPYTADDLNYMNSSARSMTEMRDPDTRPAITALPADWSAYDTVILCYPIWGGQAPMIIRTFLENADMAGKTVIPFATSGSSGIGNSDAALRALTDESIVWTSGKGIKRGTGAEEIIDWVKELNLE